MRNWKGDIVFLLVVGALIGGWIYLYPRPGDSPLSPLDIPVDLDVIEIPSYASSEGLKLAYRLYEPAGDVKCVLVFLHDTLLHSGWYINLGRDLAKEGIAVYLPDRRGRGHSAGDPREVFQDKSVLDTDITAMIAVAQSRFPQKKIFLGGHGRGAGLVMRYIAFQRPLPGAVLVSPYISDDQPNVNPEGWRDLVTAHPGEAFLAQSGLIYWRVWHHNWPRSMREADPLIETKYSISWQQETLPDDVGAAYRALTVPLLCLQGRDDPLFDADKAADLMSLFSTPDRQLEILPNADYLDIIDVAANPIANWLAGR